MPARAVSDEADWRAERVSERMDLVPDRPRSVGLGPV
jgi:hypothetical protein